MSKRLWLLAVILIFLAGVIVVKLASQSSPAGLSATSTKPSAYPALTARHFAMGFVPIPAQPLSQKTWLEAFQLFRQSAEVIMQHRHFGEAEAASLDLVAQLAAAHQLSLFVVIDPLSDNREQLDPALAKLGKGFGDPAVREKYQQVALEVVRKYHPTYLSFGSEVNTYFAKHPKELPAYQSLVQETSAALKRLAPATKTTISFQYETLSGAYGSEQWATLEALEPLLDQVAFTTYPNLVFSHPTEIPANYYSAITQHTTKNLIVAESGWPSSSKNDNQALFVDNFSRLINQLPVSLWIWWFPHDWSLGGYGSTFAKMGLRTARGEAKPAWQAWQKIFFLPRSS